MLKCPYCGSSRLQTTGGDIGNPFDRRKEKTICTDCGRTVGTEPDISASPMCRMKQQDNIPLTLPISNRWRKR